MVSRRRSLLDQWEEDEEINEEEFPFDLDERGLNDGLYEGYDPCYDIDDYLACREKLEGEDNGQE